MTKYNQLTVSQKNRIIALSEVAKMSSRKIAAEIGCHFTKVCVFLKNFKNYGTIERKKGTGPKRMTTKREDRHFVRQLNESRFKTAVEIRGQFVAETGRQIGVHTVRNRLREQGFMARHPAKKPLLTKKMQQKRLEWARKHADWSLHKWRTVIFSDESKFNLFGSDGIQYVRRKVGERLSGKCLKLTVKHPPGQMIWGCFSYHGIGELAFIKGTVNAEIYKQILKDHLFPSIEKHFLGAKSVIFQDDSAPCHRAKSVSFILFTSTLYTFQKQK